MRKKQLDINLGTDLISINIKSTTTDDIIKEIKKLYRNAQK